MNVSGKTSGLGAADTVNIKRYCVSGFNVCADLSPSVLVVLFLLETVTK